MFSERNVEWEKSFVTKSNSFKAVKSSERYVMTTTGWGGGGEAINAKNHSARTGNHFKKNLLSLEHWVASLSKVRVQWPVSRCRSFHLFDPWISCSLSIKKQSNMLFDLKQCIFYVCLENACFLNLNAKNPRNVWIISSPVAGPRNQVAILQKGDALPGRKRALFEPTRYTLGV